MSLRTFVRSSAFRIKPVFIKQHCPIYPIVSQNYFKHFCNGSFVKLLIHLEGQGLSNKYSNIFFSKYIFILQVRKGNLNNNQIILYVKGPGSNRLFTLWLYTNYLSRYVWEQEAHKGSLISKKISLWLQSSRKCAQNYPEHLLFSRIELRIVFGTFFGRLEPTCKLSEIKSPLGNLENVKSSLARSRDIAVKFHCKSCLLIQIKITEALVRIAVAFY